MIELQLPHCTEIEKSIIAEFMSDHRKWARFSYLINPKYFYHDLHQKIIEFMFESNVTDMLIIRDKFPQHETEIIGMVADFFSAVANLEPQIAVLKDRYERRKIIEAAYNAQQQAADFEVSSSEIVESAISGMSTTITYDSRPEHIREISQKLFDEMSKGESGLGLKSGLVDFDRVIGGLCPGEMVILAARPSMGKTTFALQIARYNAIQNNVPTLIFSIETSKAVMAGRIICSEGNANYEQALRGHKSELMKMGVAVGPVAESNIYIDDTAAISMQQIESKVECFVKNHGIKLVIIDHVGLIKSMGRGRSRHEELSEISKAIKALGKRYNIPTLTICQLSREVEKRKPPIPIMSDLRESGSFEEDADKVVFLYREEYYNRKSEKRGICDVIVAKNKNGRTGHREVKAELETMNFRNLEKEEWPEEGKQTDDWRQEY